jgi:hypothetical protein
MQTALNNLTPDTPPPSYNPFGKYAGVAKSQGWYPQTSWFNNGIVYASPYNNAFKDVVIPDQPNKKGDIALIGYPNNTFDIVIRDKSGNIEHTINKGVSPDFVQNYITNSNSVVAERKNNIDKTTDATAMQANKLATALSNF